MEGPKTWDGSLIIGIIYTITYGISIGISMTVQIPEANQTTVSVLLGAMTIIQTTIVQYWFGSNKIADDNQKLIAQKMTVSAPVEADDVTVKAKGRVSVHKEKPK